MNFSHRVAVFALLTLASACQKPPTPLPPPPPPTVSVALPIPAEVPDYRYQTGRVEAVERVEIRARVRGYLDKVHFQEGAEVKKGDLLYEIDPRTFQATLAMTEADVVRLEAELKLAYSEAERATRLRGRGAGSEEEYLQKIAAREAANAKLLQARAAVEAARLELGFTRIVAPVSGRVSRTLVTEGNLVGYNEPTLLTTIVSMDPVYVYFESPERDYLDYQKLRREQGVPGAMDRKLRVEIGLDNEDGFPHEGVLDFRDNQVDPSTGTLLLRARMDNPDRLITPGLFARVRVPFGKPKPRLMVPEEALAADQRGRYLLLVKPDNTVEYRSVKPGITVSGFCSIEKGLKADERVVVLGLLKARPGQPVKPEIVNPSLPPELASSKPITLDTATAHTGR